MQGRQGKVGLLSFVRWGSKPIAIHQAPSSITDEKLDARGRPVRRSSLKDMNAEPRSKSVTVDAPAVRKATDPAIRSKDKEMTAAEATALLDSARDRKLPEVSDAEITTKPGEPNFNLLIYAFPNNVDMQASPFGRQQLTQLVYLNEASSLG